MENLAIKAFAARINEELIVAQVVIRKAGGGFELCHVNDRSTERASLRGASLAEVRGLSQFTAGGAFRPLKSAPNLATGWHLRLQNEAELGFALNQLYPGAVADWFVAQPDRPPVTHFRTFTNRQSGMYRITSMLDDHQAAMVIASCCDAKFCLKRRLWSIDADHHSADSAAEKSIIPCLEPCAIFLELARKAVRIEQQKNVNVTLATEEIETLEAALNGLAQNGKSTREADFNSPTNPRRIQLLQEKIKRLPIEPRPSIEKE